MTGHHAYGPTGAGTVLLDLGPGAGALILFTPAELAGREIEISPGGPDESGPGTGRAHAAVRERPGPHGPRYAVVYAGLAPGGYTIWTDHTTPAGTVTITGGQVTCHDWV